MVTAGGATADCSSTTPRCVYSCSQQWLQLPSSGLRQRQVEPGDKELHESIEPPQAIPPAGQQQFQLAVDLLQLSFSMDVFRHWLPGTVEEKTVGVGGRPRVGLARSETAVLCCDLLCPRKC